MKNIFLTCSVALISFFNAACQKNEFGTVDLTIPEEVYTPIAAQYTFNHPCGMYNQADFDRVKSMLDDGTAPQPVKDELQLLKNSKYTVLPYEPHPTEYIVRGDPTGVPGGEENSDYSMVDAASAYQMALLWKLTGGEVHATDVTNASRTLLFNIHTLTWDQELCDLFKIPMRILPEILDNNAEFGRVKVDLFGLDCPILAMIGDQQAALFGESCLKKGDIKNTYGTGGFILVNTADELIISESGLLSTIAWRLDSKVTYALEGSIFVSGSLIQWLRDGLGIIKSAQDSKELALKVKDSGGIVIIPAFVGLGAPYWDDHCRGSILGITRGTKDAHIARAALEAMAFSVKNLIDVIEKETGLSAADLKVDGGASANDLLLEIQSSVLNKDVVKKKVKEATALGAARIAGLKAGLYKIEDLKDDEESIIHPSDSTMMIETYKRWKRALEVTRMFA